MMMFKEDGQDYAQVLRRLPGGLVEASFTDGFNRLCSISYMTYVAIGDIILVGRRANIIHRYMPHEIQILKNIGELPDHFLSTYYNSKDDPFDFTYDDD